nr:MULTISPECIES: type II toxin-antitoxin system RelB/DinJ family antitoxin [unclassified Shigella]
MNLSPSDAIRLFLRYVAENEKLPFSELFVVVGEQDEDKDILANENAKVEHVLASI